MTITTTVLIPTYRRPAMLRRAIASAVEQEGARVRVHVFDNCSGDETANVVKEFSSRFPFVDYHCHERNLGATANFEFALRSVSTPYFSILSDDDYLLPGFISRAVGGLENEPMAAFWAGTTLNVDESGRIWDARVTRWPRFGLLRPPEGVLALLSGMAPAWTSILFRHAVLAASGLPDLEMQGPSDLDYILRLASMHAYLVDSHPSAVFTLNATSYSATQPLSSFSPGWRKMISNAEGCEFLAPVDRVRISARIRADFHRMLLRRGANALAAGRVGFAKEAAALLAREPGQAAKAGMLRTLAGACDRAPFFQRIYTRAYGAAERRLVASRSELQERYGSLLRSV